MSFLLRKAARHWGVQTGFTNALGDPVDTPEKSLIAILEILSGQKLKDQKKESKVKFYESLIHQAHKNIYHRWLEPVSVIEEKKRFSLKVYFPESLLQNPLRIKAQLEDGGTFELKPTFVERDRKFSFEGETYVRFIFTFSQIFPVGYHKVTFSRGNLERHGTVLCAPEVKSLNPGGKKWGLFVPLYAVKSTHDWGIGGLTELKQTRQFVFENGGSFVGTLPLLATQHEGPNADHSPYSPLSKLYWNEIFLDIEKLNEEKPPQWEQTSLVDYQKVYHLKKKELLKLSERFFDSKEKDSAEYKEFLSHSPLVQDYARFRAQDDLKEYHFHLYVQFQMDQELKRQKKEVDENQLAGLYMDFPVGVSRHGFDCRFFSSSFLQEASAGAPPDLMFSAGQNWGISPLHPINLREEGYDYFIRCLRHHMRYAHLLRFDHAMAFHRIYVVPKGLNAKEGVYIRFKQDEFLAILKIEAHRNGVQVIGEDLGTVPEEVREGLLENGFYRMWVLPFEAGAKPTKAAEKAPRRSLACFNTHDMIPFEGYLHFEDLKLFERLKILTPKQVDKELKDRKKALASWMKDLKVKELPQLFERLLEVIAHSPSELFLMNLEDLWRETKPQNVPGTSKENPNWRRRFSRPIEEWTKDPEILLTLSLVSQWRDEMKRKALL